MSRVAKNPISLPAGVQVNLQDQLITIKGAKGQLSHQLHDLVTVKVENDVLQILPVELSKSSGGVNRLANFLHAIAGTTRALISNIVTGVTTGFERKLILKGVGYKAQLQGKALNLSLGFSHPVNFDIPTGITIEVPNPTEIVIKGVDKQLVGQVAANIRAYRPPEPYKGKGIRYSDEEVKIKETKKK